MKQICGDCLHYYACAAWNIGSLANMEAGSCVNYTPASDVVEVVRCKDCVHYNSDYEACLDEMGYARTWHKNDYCSFGKRKEG